MRALHIDLAPHPVLRALWRASATEWLLLIAGIALCVVGGLTWLRQDHALVGLRADLAQMQSLLVARQSRSRPAPAKPVPAAETSAVAALIDQLNLPWAGLLDALEQADQPGVAVLELTPLPRQRMLRGTAEARNIGAMLAYLRRLQSQPAFDAARLVRHEHTDQDPTQPVRFEFEATWRSDAP